MHNVFVTIEQQLAEAKKKLLDLERQKLAIEQRMRGWVQIIEGYQTLLQDAPFDEVGLTPPPTWEEIGLTDRVRELLRTAKAPTGATQIRDQLQSEGVDASTAKNLLINIHTILRRLREGGEVEEVPLSDGTKLYRHVTLLQRVLDSQPPNRRAFPSRFPSRFKGRFPKE